MLPIGAGATLTDRPSSHVVGDAGELAVAAIWNEIGCAVSFVHRDYGEDLMVQTRVGRSLDASRVWVQVKSTTNSPRHRLRSGDFRVTVSAYQALRWTQSTDLVVLVFWDSTFSRGWWTLPVNQLDHSALMLSGQKTVTLRVADSDRFDTSGALFLAWQARIEHLWRLATAEAAYNLSREYEIAGGDKPIPFPDVVHAAFNFMVDIDAVDDDGLTESFRQTVANVIENSREDADSDYSSRSEEEQLSEALTLAIMAQVEDNAAGNGLYFLVIDRLVRVAGSLLDTTQASAFLDSYSST